MKTFSYQFNVPADNESEAESKMRALKTLSEKLSAKSLHAFASKLSAKELEKIAEVIGNPIKLMVVKQKLGK